VILLHADDPKVVSAMLPLVYSFDEELKHTDNGIGESNTEAKA